MSYPEPGYYESSEYKAETRRLVRGLVVLGLALLLWLAACTRLQHVPAEPRSSADAARSVVFVEVACGDGDPWASSRHGVGVIVSERHVLTAAHVTACPAIPVVHVTFRGVRWRAVVELEDGAQDLARLELATAETFHLTDVPPPELGDLAQGEPARAYVWPRGAVVYGSAFGPSWVSLMHTHPGDSGAPVYNTRGQLVGLVSAGNGQDTTLAPVSAYWLGGL